MKKYEIQRIVDDPEWQELRRSFLGTWKSDQEKNCQKLREYLGNFSDYLKLRRVQNYLTGSGFRIGIISHPEITILLTQVKEKLNEYKTQGH
jgi:hypothetical protein